MSIIRRKKFLSRLHISVTKYSYRDRIKHRYQKLRQPGKTLKEPRTNIKNKIFVALVFVDPKVKGRSFTFHSLLQVRNHKDVLIRASLK